MSVAVIGRDSIVMANARDDYHELINHVVDHGDPVTVRGQLTYELTGATLVLEDPLDALPRDIGVRLDVGAAVDGFLALVSGVDDGAWHGSYGSRIRYQMRDLEQLIAMSPTTRQAVTFVGDPMYDHVVPEQNDALNAVIAHQFLFRDNKVSMQVYMRSCDVFGGLATGMFQMGQFLATFANVLNAPAIGTLTFHFGSLHVYARDRGEIDHFPENQPGRPVPVPEPRAADAPVGLAVTTWDNAVDRARWLRSAAKDRTSEPSLFRTVTATERWYLQQLGANL